MRRMHGCQQQLKDFRAQLDTVATRKAEIIALLDKAVNGSHPQRDALLTIFHRKLKRSRKKVNEDEEEDSNDEEGGDDDFDDDDAQEMCPPGCDQALYDEVCCLPHDRILSEPREELVPSHTCIPVCLDTGWKLEDRAQVFVSMVQICVMREQRLDQEDVIADITKGCDQVKKEQESLKQKLKRIDQALAATESDIQEFQREKQASLNEIEVMVLMHAHQIEYLVDQRLPTDLSGALVFSNAELSRLRIRIDVRICFRPLILPQTFRI
jgi:cilia- and flagella-associated protein 44